VLRVEHCDWTTTRCDLTARWPNRVLHCGCGTGYYTAIIAHVVGSSGHVIAIELEESLASLVEKNLRDLSHVEVIAGDATTYDAGKVNADLCECRRHTSDAALARQSHAWRQVYFPDGAIS
jgi:tRNA A58 N-methylase Trm61